MEKIFLKKSLYFSSALLIGSSIYAPTHTPVAAIAATHVYNLKELKALETIHNSFDIRKRKNYYISFKELIDSLSVFTGQTYPETVVPQMLFETVQQQVDNLPEELQNLFAYMTFAEFDVIVREKKAFDYFYALLNAPEHDVPTWKHFVDTIVKLLAGNHVYANLRAKLLETREILDTSMTEWIGKVRIGTRLNDCLSELPLKIQKKITDLGVKKLARRVRR